MHKAAQELFKIERIIKKKGNKSSVNALDILVFLRHGLTTITWLNYKSPTY